jgi:hypothetical protein
MSESIKINDIVKIAQARAGINANKELITLLPEFVELLSTKFCHDILTASKKGEGNVVFVNFWRVSWSKGKGDFSGMRAGFSATSAARNLTQKFNEGENIVDIELEDYFHQVISRPKAHLELIENITTNARESRNLYPDELKLGKNIAFLFRTLFSAILFATFESKQSVHIPGIGIFERNFKIKKKRTSKETAGGVLQFLPKPSQLT